MAPSIIHQVKDATISFKNREASASHKEALQVVVELRNFVSRANEKHFYGLTNPKMLPPPLNKNRYASEQMKSYVGNDTECRRVQIYKQFLKGEAIQSNEPMCSCCDMCSAQCLCGKWKDSVYNSHFLY